jgi:acid phosphatase family membrane protein YuiD
VAEFRTASGARDEAANEIASDSTWIAFPVGGIPGAHAAAVTPNAYAVTFSDGRFQYGIFAVFHSSAATALAKAQMIAAAQALYRRVHGR